MLAKRVDDMLRVMRISYRVSSDKKAEVSERMAHLELQAAPPTLQCYAKSLSDSVSSSRESGDSLPSVRQTTLARQVHRTGGMLAPAADVFHGLYMDLQNGRKSTCRHRRCGAPSSRLTNTVRGRATWCGRECEEVDASAANASALQEMPPVSLSFTHSVFPVLLASG